MITLLFKKTKTIMENKIATLLLIHVMICFSAETLALDIKRYVRVGGIGNGTSSGTSSI